MPSRRNCSVAAFRSTLASCSVASGLFQRTLGDGALVVKNLRPLELHARQALIVLGLEIGLVGAGDIVAPDSQQAIALFHHVAQPGFDLHNSSRGQRDHGHGAGDIGLHHASHIQSRRGLVLNRRRQRKLVGVIDFEIVGSPGPARRLPQAELRPWGRPCRRIAGRKTKRQRKATPAAIAETNLKDRFSWQNLPPHGHVQLRRGGQI